MSLYNCKADGDHWRITKFTPDLEVESSYLVSAEACDCPAGHRHTCRHRQMLPLFESKPATRGQFFLDFDRKVWIRAISEDQESTVPVPSQGIDEDEVEIIEPMSHMGNGTPHLGGVYAKDVTPAHGFTMLDLANPLSTHNTLAEALGEPPLPPKSDLRRI